MGSVKCALNLPHRRPVAFAARRRYTSHAPRASAYVRRARARIQLRFAVGGIAGLPTGNPEVSARLETAALLSAAPHGYGSRPSLSIHFSRIRLGWRVARKGGRAAPGRFHISMFDATPASR